jgi:hypothetical protein
MNTKYFDIIDVMGAASGVLLKEGGFGGIHEVMDHFFPGIMTIGCAAMSKHAAAEIFRQHPDVKQFCERNDPKDYQVFAQKAKIEFPDTLALSGPLQLDEGEISAAFDSFFENNK